MKNILTKFVGLAILTLSIQANAGVHNFPSTQAEIVSLSKWYSSFHKLRDLAVKEGDEAKVALLDENSASAHSSNIRTEYGLNRIRQFCENLGIELLIE